jgi:hypothetical protein
VRLVVFVRVVRVHSSRHAASLETICSRLVDERGKISGVGRSIAQMVIELPMV